MNPRMTQTLGRARNLVAGFTPAQKAIVVLAALGLVLGAFGLSRWAAQPTWTPLFTQLSGADASAVVDQLGSQGVQYQLSDGGATVLVPQSQVYDLRVSLMGKGLPANTDGAGWSILDKQGMTATDFQQNIAYQRALEGELSKTLGAITGVKTAIVHLAIPKRDVFATEQDKTTASVLLALTPGATLTRAQVRSVTMLVAGSIPGLAASDVTVTDGAGNLLSSRTDGAAGAASAANDADQQTAQYEDRMSESLQQMLDKVLGPNHAVVRVNAQLNYNAKDTTSQIYVSSPGVSPLSEQTTLETYNGTGAGPGGALGVITPTPLGTASGAGGYLKQDRTVDNAVGSVVTKEQTAPGAVQRLSVAVVLDSNTTGTTDVAKVTSLISNAVGINTVRGDTVQVDKLAFDTTAAKTAQKEVAAQQSAAQMAQYIDLGKKAGLVLLAIILGFVLMRRSKSDTPSVDATASDLPKGLLMPARLDAIGADRMAAIEAGGATDPALERERLRGQVAEFVDSQPDEIAHLVQGWLSKK